MSTEEEKEKNLSKNKCERCILSRDKFPQIWTSDFRDFKMSSEEERKKCPKSNVSDVFSLCLKTDLFYDFFSSSSVFCMQLVVKRTVSENGAVCELALASV